MDSLRSSDFAHAYNGLRGHAWAACDSMFFEDEGLVDDDDVYIIGEKVIPLRSQEKRKKSKGRRSKKRIHVVDAEANRVKEAAAPSAKRRVKVTAAPVSQVPSTLFAELQALQEKDGLIGNTEQFDCIICLETVNIGDGVVLRDCLHQFCKQCTKGAIVTSENAEIPCPFGNGKNRCDGIILDHEIRAIASAAEYETYLNRSLRIAEANIANTVHCKKVDCIVWCICDDDVKQFDCPKCKSPNCVPCEAIHVGRGCKKFQDEIKHNAAIQRTNQYLEGMIAKKNAMNCPKCKIVIMKRSGCDWLQCSMCRTEICWVTKQARWGPRGRGDSSSGCRCGVDNKKCHPKCGFCH